MTNENAQNAAPVDGDGYANFLALPIVFDSEEVNADGWRRRTKRHGNVGELLDIWDIDDESETSEMAQVLRHLRRIMSA